MKKQYDDFFINGISDYPQMSVEDEEIIFRKKNINTEDRHRLLLSNIKLIVVIAKEYNYDGVSIKDLIQEGCLGLLEAIDKYDRDMIGKVKFMSYANHWIRKNIRNAIHQVRIGHSVIIPKAKLQSMKKINKITKDIEKSQNRTPTNAEISSATGLSKRTIINCNSIDNSGIMSLEECRGNGFNYDIEEENDFKDEHVLHVKKCLTKIVNKLPAREKYIIEKRFFEKQTLKSVSEKIGLSKERVRQIQNKTLRRMKIDLKKEII